MDDYYILYNDPEYYENADDYHESIDILKFFEGSKGEFAMSRTCARQVASGMVETGAFVETYFRLLPIEMIEFIFEMAGKLIERDEFKFYERHFSPEQSNRHILRQMRVRPGVPDVTGTRYKDVATPLGTIKCRNIYVDNDMDKCNRAFSKVVESGLNTIEGVAEMKKTMEEWFLWVCDHAYSDHWGNFMRVFVKKIYQCEEILWDLQNQRLRLPNFSTEEQICELEHLIRQMKYFVEYYLPYALLTRNQAYYCLHPDMKSYSEVLFDLFKITGVHPDTIDLDEVYEFEMETYAPDYYYDTYLKYPVAENGVRAIPPGEKPLFYWRGGEYACTFV
jgi:hypothetical protein